MNAELETDYEAWAANYDDHKSARVAAGIRDIYRGSVLDKPDNIRVVMWVPSMEVMESFIDEHKDHIENSGHKLDTTEVTLCSD